MFDTFPKEKQKKICMKRIIWLKKTVRRELEEGWYSGHYLFENVLSEIHNNN